MFKKFYNVLVIEIFLPLNSYSDSLTIYDGGSKASSLIETYCGTKYEGGYVLGGDMDYHESKNFKDRISSGNEAFLHLETSYVNTAAGFEIEYSAFGKFDLILCLGKHETDIIDKIFFGLGCANVSNGVCDEENKNEECFYDGGDCKKSNRFDYEFH